jgi:hypothetical protein
MVVNGSAGKDDLEDVENSNDDDAAGSDRHPPKRSISATAPGRRRLPIAVAGVVVAAAIALIAVVVTTGSSGKKSPRASSSTTVPSASSFTPFLDRQANFSLTYPSAWTVAADSDAAVPLHLVIGQSGLDALLVRVVALQQSVDTSNEANIKAYTDAVISGTNVNVLQQKAVTINGLVGYYYFYSLPHDPTINATLVHSHFFLFPPHEMVSLTFQATSDDFTGLAHTFDQVIGSFHTAS